jgi:hypothetical protein
MTAVMATRRGAATSMRSRAHKHQKETGAEQGLHDARLGAQNGKHCPNQPGVDVRPAQEHAAREREHVRNDHLDRMAVRGSEGNLRGGGGGAAQSIHQH